LNIESILSINKEMKKNENQKQDYLGVKKEVKTK
jgi:hypothetical protein